MDRIIRGTTPTIRYTFSDIDVTKITVAILTISSNGAVVLEKYLDTATAGEGSLEWELTQQETLGLPLGDARVDLNWKLHAGTRGVGNPRDVKVVRNPKEEVI